MIFSACNDDDESPSPQNQIELQNHSVTPSFLTLTSEFSSVNVYPVLSSEDQLKESPNFVYETMADGAGLLNNDDETFKPVKGEYILNSNASARTAKCSGLLITPEEHGFSLHYLSGGEWGGSSKGVFVTDPYKNADSASSAEMLPAFGQLST